MKSLILLTSIFTLTLACSHQHQDESSEIKLNDGNKWEINEEMKPHMQNAEMTLAEFINTDNEDYVELAEELKEHNQKLINSCTMDGEGHEELHKWLYNHMQLIDELQMASNEDDVNSAKEKIDKSFQTFHKYFE